MSDSVQSRILDRLTDVIAAIGTGGGGGGSGSATSAKQDEQTGHLTSISSDSASIVTTLGDTTGNPDPHTTAWYLKHVHGGLGTIDGNVSNIKDNVASVLPFIGLDTTAIRAQIPSSLGAKTGANSLSVVLATDSAISSNVSTINSNISNIKDNVASVLPYIGLDTAAIRAQIPASLGAKTAANSLSVTPATDAIYTQKSSAFQSSANLTRGANTTIYAANDVIFGSFEFQNIGNSGGYIFITDIRFLMNITYLPSNIGNLRLFLYNVSPPSAVADNGAFSVPSGDRASILTPSGISLGTPALALGGGSLVLALNNINRQFKLSSTSLFGYLVTEGAWVPTANSETATLTVMAVEA
jgi:ribosomal protein L27